jgi:hypothetical protein
MGPSNRKLPLIGPSVLSIDIPVVNTTWLPKARQKLKRRNRKPNKGQCLCGCGMKRNPKRRFVAGHSFSAKCFPERIPARADKSQG